jgi:hypothetical protein
MQYCILFVVFTDTTEMQQSYKQLVSAQMGYHRVIREQYTNHDGIYIYNININLKMCYIYFDLIIINTVLTTF